MASKGLNGGRRGAGEAAVVALWGLAVLALVIVVFGAMWGMPQWGVYRQTMIGTAELRRAEQNRQIQIEEAKAENEAATSRAEAQIKIAEAEATAEVRRAEGVAQANRIIAEGLKGNSEYLHYLWIQSLRSGDNKIIYVPTEAGLPVLEASRLGGVK